MNLRDVLRASLALAGALACAACDGDPSSLTGGPGPKGSSGGDEQGENAAALECTAAPQGRSYVLFDGTKLEASRENENLGVNRARVKPHKAMAREFQRVLGAVPPSLEASGGSFDAPAARWYGEQEYSGVSILAMATISFEGCLAYTKADPAFAAAPTPETAAAECSKLMRKAWSRTPSPDEVSGCADLATSLTEKDVRRRWAYVCSSVLSASQFLTF